MNISTEESNLRGVVLQLAKIGAVHGYRFDGDVVSLNAMFSVLDSRAHQTNWALQLWACPVQPRNAAEITGHLVVSIALPPIGEIADDTESFEVSGPAWAPASQAEQVMVLALVSGTAGQYSLVQDFVVFPCTERFVQPRLAGNVGFNVEGNRVRIHAGRIENPRDEANISGTLALELWALEQPYNGSRFNGIPLAGVAFDPLNGQYEYVQRSFDLPFVAPPAGSWNLVLMLREWTAAGYVTRDYTNFGVPMVVAPAPVTPVPAKTAAEASPSPAKAAREVKAPSKPATKAAAKAAPAAQPEVISVNSATRAELSKIKGLSTKVIEEIVKKRPFRSMDELAKCKGLGAKLLANLRSKLRL